ncbi:hypothetical protein RSAG8_04078, partial [Rhizoctonia solani AG-8 WAC10335]
MPQIASTPNTRVVVGTTFIPTPLSSSPSSPPDQGTMFEFNDRKQYILAHITKAKGAEGNAAIDFVSFTQFGRSVILDIASVKCVVGRVFTKGVKPSGEWYLIDRGADMCETVFHPPEHAYEDDD